MAESLPRITLLVENRTGYKNLCRLLTAGALGKPKGEAVVTLEQVAAHAEGLHCLTGGEEGPLAKALTREGLDSALSLLDSLAGIFPGRLHVELQRHRLAGQEHRNQALGDLARRLRLPLLASTRTGTPTAVLRTEAFTPPEPAPITKRSTSYSAIAHRPLGRPQFGYSRPAQSKALISAKPEISAAASPLAGAVRSCSRASSSPRAPQQ